MPSPVILKLRLKKLKEFHELIKVIWQWQVENPVMLHLLCRGVLSFTSWWQFFVSCHLLLLRRRARRVWLLCRHAKFLFEVAALAIGVWSVEGTAQFGLRVVLEGRVAAAQKFSIVVHSSIVESTFDKDKLIVLVEGLFAGRMVLVGGAKGLSVFELTEELHTDAAALLYLGRVVSYTVFGLDVLFDHVATQACHSFLVVPHRDYLICHLLQVTLLFIL